MRLLGVDFGFKRIGIAVAETSPAIVTARPALEASGTLKTDAARIAEMAQREEVAGVVVGLPIEQSGDEGRMARICRDLAGHIQAQGLDVFLIDETLTSVQADANLRGDAGLRASQRRKLKDGEAACLILERYIHEQEIG